MSVVWLADEVVNQSRVNRRNHGMRLAEQVRTIAKAQAVADLCTSATKMMVGGTDLQSHVRVKHIQSNVFENYKIMCRILEIDLAMAYSCISQK